MDPHPTLELVREGDFASGLQSNYDTHVPIHDRPNLSQIQISTGYNSSLSIMTGRLAHNW